MKRILTATVALGIAAFAAVSALALNIDQNRTFPARISPEQQVHYYRVTVNYSDANISTAQRFGTLPMGSFITDLKCEIVTVFNAVTTNVLTLGTTTTATELVAAGDVDELTAGVTTVTRGLGRGLTAAADTALYAKYTQTGTAATTGVATCVIAYIPNNDL